jgi:ribosomal protein S18 acetylase RimI-like enzyme
MILSIGPQHLDAFIELRRKSITLHPEAFGADPDAPIDREKTLRSLQQKNEEDFILCYQEDQQLVGITGFIRHTKPKYRHKAQIWGMYVDPDYRGRDIGRSLLQETIKRAQKLPDLKMITLTVTDQAPGAYALYKAMGFEEFGREPHGMEWKGEAFEVIYMQKRTTR